MADYGTLNGVRGWMPGGAAIDDQASNPPTATTVSGWITKRSGEVDAAFASAGETTPITNAAVLSKIAIILEPKIAYDVMTVRGAVKDSDKELLYIGWDDAYTAMLEDVAENGIGAFDVESGEPWMTGMDSVEGDEFSAAITKDRVF